MARMLREQYYDVQRNILDKIGEDSPMDSKTIKGLAAYFTIDVLRGLVNRKENILNDQKKQIGWGNQIRSYVFHPYKLIKDLRTEHESSNVNDVLDGEINSFLEKSLSL